MKKHLSLFLFFSFFSFSQVEIPIIDFASGDYPIGEKVKILYDKDWKPVTELDSADFYRIVNFKEKNIPSVIINDYYLNDIKQSSFYATYVGLDSKGIDSVSLNGPTYYYHSNGNKSWDVFFLNNIKEGEEKLYYESGIIKVMATNINGLWEGEKLNYYESGKISQKSNYINGIKEGIVKDYYETGELKSTIFFINNIRQQTIGYNKNGFISYKANYTNNLPNGEQIFYHASGELRGVINYVDGFQNGEEVFYYPSGEISYTANNINGLTQGEQIAYYESGEIQYTVNWVDNLKQGEQISYYESGEIEFKRNWVDNLKKGEQVNYYESGEVKETLKYVDDLKQGLLTNYLKNGKIDYTELYLDDKRVDRKIALVIGNAAYEKGPLENPVNDANLIAETLEKLDFEVELYNNLSSRDEMLDAIKDFGRKRKNYEVAFVYYAGHGIQLNNENYLLPVNEEFEFEDDVEDNGVSMQRLLRYLESTRENQLNFIVLDACRDNPFESNWNKTRSLKGAGLAKIPPPTGSLIAFSTDHGQTAADGDGGNSLYSQALAEKLLEENVSIEQVFKNVRTEVLKLSGDTQSPVEESKLTGEAFYLNKTNN